MLSILLFTLSLSLFDSFSTTQQIIIFALLLTTNKPLRNSMAYLTGLTGSYILCGVVGYLALDQMNTFIGKYFSTRNMSDIQYYLFEFISGVAMLIFGIWYYYNKRNKPPSRTQNIIVSKLKSINPTLSFFTGLLISVTSFPVSVPYIIALGKYTTLHLGFPAVMGNILLYNTGYALPMLVILLIYLYARKRTDDLTGTLHEKTRILNIQLTTWVLVIVGIFSMIDAGCYYAIGHALLKGRYF
jgi:cytochrome c biogenesis protein CcdA